MGWGVLDKSEEKTLVFFVYFEWFVVQISTAFLVTEKNRLLPRKARKTRKVADGFVGV